MSKSFVPSRNLLSIFSRSLRYENPQLFSTQCHRFSSITPSTLPRPTPQLCLRSTSRSFSTSSSRPYKTVQEQRSRYRSGVRLPLPCPLSPNHLYSAPQLPLTSTKPFSWKAGLLFLSAGAGLIFYFRYEKARMERKRVAEAAKGVGRPKVGGPFSLVDQNGKTFTDGDMKEKYALVSFIFRKWEDTGERNECRLRMV